MKNTRAALRYAKATLSSSLDQNNETATALDMQKIVSVFEENKDLISFLENPVITNSAKKEALQKIFSSLSTLTNQLVQLLATNNRIDLLNQVAESYLNLLQKHQGKETALVTTAFPLTPDLEQTILAKAKQLSSAELQLENIIDPTIIGGFILRIGDLQYNASVSHQLNQLKQEFTQTNYSA